MTHKTLALLASVAAGWMIASAAPAADVSTARVSYADLDLAHGAGRDSLYARLRFAADSVCGSVDIRELKALALKRACTDRALERAVRELNVARLGAAPGGRTAQFAKAG